MSYTILKKSDSVARSKFTYKSETVDEWRSHAKDVYSGKSWTGDCDDLASTVCHLAIDAGVKKSDLWFGMVSSNGGKKVDHLIAIAKAGLDFYVIGDTNGEIYKLSRMKYRLLFIHRLDWELTRWERGLPS